MEKTMNNVKIYVAWTQAATRSNILPGNGNNPENISTSLGKISKWFADLKDTAFMESSSFATQNHTHPYIPLSGSDSITGNLAINVKNRGYWLTDSSGVSYPGIFDNGSNLWIGAQKAASTHHIGETVISAGYNSTNNTGNKTIRIGVPNTTNDGATLYYALHSGNTSFSQTITAATTNHYEIGNITINDENKTVYGKDTTYSAGTGLSLSNTTINHSNAITSGTASGTSGQVEFGGTINIPSISYDGQGHITGKSTTEAKLISTHNPTSATVYGIMFGNNGKSGAGVNNGFQYNTLEGTESSTGYAIVRVGNSTPTGTDGNKQGRIDLYSTGAYRTLLKYDDNASSDSTQTFPNVTGTLLNTGNYTEYCATNNHTHSTVGNTLYSGNAVTFYFPLMSGYTTNPSRNVYTVNSIYARYIPSVDTTDVGDSHITLGNNTPKGTAGNAEGKLYLFSESSGYAIIKTSPMTYHPTYQLPAKTNNNTYTFALKEDLEQSWVSVTTASGSSVSSLNAKYNMSGKVVEIVGEFTPNASGVAVHTLFTLPENYRPTSYNRIFVCQKEGVYNNFYQMRVNTSGVVEMLGQGGSSTHAFEKDTTYSFNGTFIAG